MTLLQRQAPLAPEWYWKPEWLERERERVFRTNWIFAGLKQELANPNDYISFTVAGVPVVIRNMRGTLAAFKNICSHRHAVIHPQGAGNGPFRCPFHGWTYDAGGVPVGIPENTRAFGFDRDDRCALALDKVQIETCGNFIFVRLAPDGLPLIDWLGKLAPCLHYVSTFFERSCGLIDETWQCNWKFGIEFTLDVLHLPFIHPGSLARHVDVAGEEKLGAKDPYGHDEYVGPHALNFLPLTSASSSYMADRADTFKMPRSESGGGYEHYFVYPNFMVGISDGTTLCLEQYDPLAPEETRVKCWLLAGTPIDRALCDSAAWRDMAEKMRDWTNVVMQEDKVACEAVQKGARHAGRNAMLGRAEDRIRHLQSTLLKEVSGD